MIKTTFYIAHMDCGAEEAMVRSALDGLIDIRHLDFDLEHRTLDVFHDELSPQDLETRIGALHLGSELRGSQSHDGMMPAAQADADDAAQRRTLSAVLFINGAFFVIEMTAGIIAGSMGLVADSLDMLADSIVYALSLWAVGAAIDRKRRVASVAGYFQLLLAGLGLVEVIRRFIGVDATPDPLTMIGVSATALLANSLCLYLLQRSRNHEAHMKASMIFTSNDVIINSGVIVAGGLVLLTESRFPDLVVGAVVFAIVLRGAFRILRLGRRS